MQGSQAYARALAKAGVLTEEESSQIQEGLAKVGKEWEADKFEASHPPRPCSSLEGSGQAQAQQLQKRMCTQAETSLQGCSA